MICQTGFATHKHQAKIITNCFYSYMICRTGYPQCSVNPRLMHTGFGTPGSLPNYTNFIVSYILRTKKMDNRQEKSLDKGFLTTPLSDRGVPAFLVYLFAMVGFIYILNPTSGLVELIPDNLPFIGNLDEGGAFVALWYGLIEFFEGKKYREKRKSS